MNLDAISSERYEDYVLGNITKDDFLSVKVVAEEKREMLDLELRQIRNKQVLL